MGLFSKPDGVLGWFIAIADYLTLAPIIIGIYIIVLGSAAYVMGYEGMSVSKGLGFIAAGLGPLLLLLLFRYIPDYEFGGNLKPNRFKS